MEWNQPEMIDKLSRKSSLVWVQFYNQLPYFCPIRTLFKKFDVVFFIIFCSVFWTKMLLSVRWTITKASWYHFKHNRIAFNDFEPFDSNLEYYVQGQFYEFRLVVIWYPIIHIHTHTLTCGRTFLAPHCR